MTFTKTLAAVAAGALVATTPSAADPASLGFAHVGTKTYQHELGYTVYSSTYMSRTMDLAPGEMIFTNTEQTPLAMPKTGVTGYAILGFRGEIIDASTNRSAPLSEVYDHHWIAVQKSHHNRLCDGKPEYVVGIGAESRNTADQFPDGYGYVVEPGQNEWGANIHLLHTEGLAGDEFTAAKECNECYYAPNKAPTCTKEQNGTFECCGESCSEHECFCPTEKGTDAPTREYALFYEVNYTYAVKDITSMSVGTMAVPDCELFYAVYENDEEPERVDSMEYTIPEDVEVVYAVGHQHTGALNISLFKNDELVCASYPRYGSQPGVAGDEFGYLVEISTCIDKDTTGSLKLSKGDKVRIDSWYWVGSNDTRIYPHPGGTHLNVMGYMYIGYTA